jgi:hypothetical protein
MCQWKIKPGDLKNYPHFDGLISPQKAQKYVTSSARVAKHNFFPFIQYVKRFRRFAKPGEKRIPKERPIRYAARLDSLIFTYYRHLLAGPYETELSKLGLENSILAYRRLKLPTSKGGKSNIHFAKEAFLRIRELGDCCAVALDISSYFESLDHELLKKLWIRLVGLPKLPADHLRVYKTITKYAWVDKREAYARLGYFGTRILNNRVLVDKFLTPYRRMPKRLCSGRDFRMKIAGGDGRKSIIKCNKLAYGIPQGAPLSDLLANLYLLDFDTILTFELQKIGGSYYRYSDDILILVPGHADEGRRFLRLARDLIRHYGPQIQIKDKKSCLIAFKRQGNDQTFDVIEGQKSKQHNNGLEYLGFRYDGRFCYLRNATISGFRRKIIRAARSAARACARRYPDKDAKALRSYLDYEGLMKKFSKVEDFDVHRGEYRKWTFWTYARRAAIEFEGWGRPILRQVRKHRKWILERADFELERAVALRKKVP